MARTNTPESRARHLRWRQIGIYGSLAAIMVLVLSISIGVWTGQLAPLVEKDFKYEPSATAEVVPIPCPLDAEATYPAPPEISIHVFNASGRQGYAKSAADFLSAQGFPAPSAGNAAAYEGVVKVIAGLEGVHNAYTVYQFMPEGSVLTLDTRTDNSVDIVLGSNYVGMRAVDQITYDREGVIEPLAQCRPAAEIAAGLTPASTSDSPEPA
ncbi:MAG: LytR C-terminal domain-containing protein [Bifidobacteriaceae bacterium]|nr:LytR C-terminal domain-containing protein [Bifidobacteriaceae bacterium]